MPYDPDKGKDMMDDTNVFGDSLDAVEHEDGYLGDPTYIGAMLRLFITEAMMGARTTEAIEASAQSVAKVLLGEEGKAKRLVGWNEPGGIDEFAAKWCGVAETDPLKRMTGAVLKLLSDCCDVMDYAAKPGVTPDQWQFQIDALVQQYALLFIGVSPATLAGM